MGIELPPPFPGGNGSPENRADRQFDARGHETPRPSGETTGNNQSVEKNASNYEPSKEVVNSHGIGDNAGQPVYKVVNDTSIYQQPGTAAPVPVLDDVPVVAADEYLIEKVWVDAVKTVITRTAGDPYARGQAISRLQADYLSKRYGKTVVPE